MHEIGHISYAHIIIHNKYKNRGLTAKSYLNIYPCALSGGTIVSTKEDEIIKNLSDILETDHEYKKLIKLYQSGIKSQIIYAILTLFFLIIFLYNFISSDTIYLILSSIAYLIPQFTLAIPTYLFAKNISNTSDRLEIKKYKKILKDIKTINKETKKLLKKRR